MNQYFEHILKLELFHNYYKDGISHDFVFEPTVQCQKLINGHRMIYRNTANGFEIFNQTMGKAGDSIVLLPKNAKLLFKLKLKNDVLLSITDLQRENGSVLYFYNQNRKDELRIRIIKLRPKLFRYSVKLKRANSIIWTVENSEGNEVYSKIINSNSSNYETEVNFEFYQSGIYHFAFRHKGRIIRQEYICIDNELFSEQPFGLVEIEKFTQKLVPKKYTYSFKSKAIPWTFHLTQRKTNHDTTYRIEQKEGHVSNDRYANFEFNFEENYAGEKPTNTLIFKSGQFNPRKRFAPMAIPFYEEAAQLQLVQYNKENDDPEYKGKVIIKRLPEPSIHNLNPIVFIYI